MSGIRSLFRGASQRGFATASSSPIRVDSALNKIKVNTAGSGTVEVDVPTVPGPGVTPLSLVANTTLSPALHGDRLLIINKVDGLTVTLPAATGTGNRYRMVIGTLMTSNSFIVAVADATDDMRGRSVVSNDTDGSASSFETANSAVLATESDTLTFNRTTTGLATIGDEVEVIDMATDIWLVNARCAANGTEATPFTAAV